MVLLLVPMLALEAHWRRMGFEPSIKDTTNVWALLRHGVQPDSMVFVGTSRIMTNLGPNAFAEEFGGRPPVQLGIPGGSPLIILENLAQDPEFRGTVVLDVLYRWIFSKTNTESGQTGWSAEKTARSHVEAYEALRTSPYTQWETWLRMQVQSRLVFTHSQLSPGAVVRSVLRGEKPAARFVVRRDRHMRIRFEAETDQAADDQGASATNASGPAMSEGERDVVLDRMARAVQQIKSRGGRVILIRLPVSGRERTDAMALFPRKMFWDVMVQRLDVPWLYTDDHPELAGFDLPDGEHLDGKDVPEFTHIFTRILKQRVGAPPVQGGGR